MAQSTIKTLIHGDSIGNGTLHIATEAGDIVIGLNDLCDPIIYQLALHGLKQKICDAAAIPRDTETGRSASPEAKFAAMRRVADNLLAGEWGITRAAGDGSGSGGLLLRALRRLYPQTPEADLAARVRGWDKKQQAAMRKHPRIAPIIAELQAAATASADIDTDSLLAELES